MYNISVIGATGYAGAELVKILVRHPDVRLNILTSESYAGKRISDIYPELNSICDIKLSELDINAVAESSDAVFLCLPHSAGMDTSAALAAKKVQVFDLSADYRLNDQALYESTYKTRHRHPELLNNAVYGLAELFQDDIAQADFVAVPGCYPTSVLIPLLPLIKEKLIDPSLLIADSKSGVSGAGRKATETTHYCEINENFKAYGLFNHRHKPEMDNIITRYAGIHTDITFTPHLAPFTRGMLSTIYTRSKADYATLISAWQNAYAAKPAVRILTDGKIPSVGAVAGTCFIDIALFKDGDKVIIVSALDNLMKGAASQAVQCFNIRMGYSSVKSLRPNF